jgi:hypothetical protein
VEKKSETTSWNIDEFITQKASLFIYKGYEMSGRYDK